MIINHSSLLMSLASGPAGSSEDWTPAQPLRNSVAAKDQAATARLEPQGECMLRGFIVDAPRASSLAAEEEFVAPKACCSCRHPWRARHPCAIDRSKTSRTQRVAITD